MSEKATLDTAEVQKRIFQNKIEHNFNTTDIHMDFALLHGEVSEAYQACWRDEEHIGEELADVAIYLLGLSEMMEINLGEEVNKKMETNENRVYSHDKDGKLVKHDKREM